MFERWWVEPDEDIWVGQGEHAGWKVSFQAGHGPYHWRLGLTEPDGAKSTITWSHGMCQLGSDAGDLSRSMRRQISAVCERLHVNVFPSSEASLVRDCVAVESLSNKFSVVSGKKIRQCLELNVDQLAAAVEELTPRYVDASSTGPDSYRATLTGLLSCSATKDRTRSGLDKLLKVIGSNYDKDCDRRDILLSEVAEIGDEALIHGLLRAAHLSDKFLGKEWVLAEDLEQVTAHRDINTFLDWLNTGTAHRPWSAAPLKSAIPKLSVGLSQSTTATTPQQRTMMTLLDDPRGWLKVLTNERPQGLNFVDFIGTGKSAAVFRALSPNGMEHAIKVYDQQRLLRFGLEIQRERINRELVLRGHDCRDLVQVYGGGAFSAGGQDFPYVDLEFVDGQDLRDRIRAGRIADVEIRGYLASLFRAVDFLDKRDLCHRDIKVDNCRLRKSGELVLLDLGVLRPTAASDLTDDENDPKTKYFLGTLRYAPPELLLRHEGNDRESWRAITIYQIGGVLYELIHGVQLFSHIREPYAELVQAVLKTIPNVMRDDIGQDLVTLTRACLVKSPEERLKLVPWDRLLEVAEAKHSAPAPTVDLASRMRAASDHYAQTVEVKQTAAAERNAQRRQTHDAALRCVQSAFGMRALAELKPRVSVLPGRTECVVLAVPANLKLRFPESLWLCCKVRMDEAAVESAHFDAIGLYGSLVHVIHPNQQLLIGKKPEEIERHGLAAVLDAVQLRPFYDALGHEPPESTSLVPRIQEWAEKMIARYFDLTESVWTSRLEAEASRIGRSSFATTSKASLVAFNLEHESTVQRTRLRASGRPAS